MLFFAFNRLSPLAVDPFAGEKIKSDIIPFYNGLNGQNRLNRPTQKQITYFLR
jgi:hypothetical protein